MKRLLPVILLLTVSAFFSFFTLAQEVEKTYAEDDSLKVVIPSTENASLNMLTPPPTFEVSQAFNGYLSMQNSSAIIMTQINNANYLKIAEGMTEEWYASQRLTFISSSDVITNHGNKGKMFKASFTLEGDPWIRYMVYIGDLEKTLWLSITYPGKLEELVEGEILKSIYSVNLNPDKNEE